MSRIGANFVRPTSMLMSDRLLSSLRNTQQRLMRAQEEIATGKQIVRPSDQPGRVSAVLLLHQQLQARRQQERNLDHALSLLNNVDHSLADVTDNLIQARSIASSQVGIGSNADTRRSEAAVIDAQLQALLDMANRKIQDVHLFGGNHAGVSGQVFQDFLGGVRYIGSTTDLRGDTGTLEPLGLNTNGADAFGALSSRVVGLMDLQPQATASTRLADLGGAQDQGVRRGTVMVSVNGTSTAVSLADADTLGDVLTRINNAISGVDPAAGSLALAGGGFDLTANAGHTIQIDDPNLGQTAGDLGLKIAASGAIVAGSDLNVRLTMLTDLADLGASIDLTSGLKITQGPQTRIADFSSALTVQDMVNQIQRLDLGLRLQINEDGRGLSLISEVSGIHLSVGENAGGTTARDLGLRTLDLSTRLEDFNFGNGVHRVAGEEDFAIQLRNGANFAINIDGSTTVGDVLARIAAAAAAAGLTVGNLGDAGADFNLGLAADGNGISFEDGTAGASEFKVTQLGLSLAATDMGIYTNAGAGGSITGEDRALVRVDSVFTHLMALRDALRKDDSRGITVAGGDIESSVERLARVRADIGVRSQRIEQQQNRSKELGLAERAMLSGIQDADLTEVITRFSQLQQQLEAALRMGAQNLQLSFLDFLR